MACFSPDRALDFVVGALPEPVAREVESHMARCGDCRRLIVEIAKNQDHGDTDLDSSPPTQSDRPRGAPVAVAKSPRLDVGSQPMGAKGPGLSLQRGTQIGRYTLLYPLGEGGMGSVHAAFDPKLDRRVALKFLHTDLVGMPREGHRDRLVREARALARLSHPNVVRIYDVAETEHSVFLAMELVDGTNARLWRELGTRGTDEIVKVYREALSALDAAHEQGIIHRDFKPDNVMVGADGAARVTDFGLARASMAEVDELLAASHDLDWATLTKTGLVLGTPRYMAPEQFRGTANERSDQFALCLSLYESLYGHYPFGTKTPRDLDPRAPLSEQMLSPLNRNRIPEALRKVILKGMSVLADDRYSSLRELDYELDQAIRPSDTSKRWAVAFALTAAIATSALVLAPDAPKPEPPNFDQYTSEIESLREEMASLRQTDSELSASQKRIAELEAMLADKERELALLQLAEEAEALAPKPRPIAPPPLPIRSVERSVTTHLSEVLACYEDTVQGDDELFVSVKVGIGPQGRARWVAPPYRGDPKASSCLEQALKRLTFPANDTNTTATLRLSFFRLDSGMLALNMRASTRSSSLGQVTVDAKGRVLVDCQPSDPLCGL